MIVACPACADPYTLANEHIAPLVQVACPTCGVRVILDFEAANDPSLRDPGTDTTPGYVDEEHYRRSSEAQAPSEPTQTDDAPAEPRRAPTSIPARQSSVQALRTSVATRAGGRRRDTTEIVAVDPGGPPSTAAPVEPAVATVEPSTVEPSPAPVELSPAPVEPSPAPVELSPAPFEPSPAPVEPHEPASLELEPDVRVRVPDEVVVDVERPLELELAGGSEPESDFEDPGFVEFERDEPAPVPEDRPTGGPRAPRRTLMGGHSPREPSSTPMGGHSPREPRRTLMGGHGPREPRSTLMGGHGLRLPARPESPVDVIDPSAVEAFHPPTDDPIEAPEARERVWSLESSGPIDVPVEPVAAAEPEVPALDEEDEMEIPMLDLTERVEASPPEPNAANRGRDQADDDEGEPPLALVEEQRVPPHTPPSPAARQAGAAPLAAEETIPRAADYSQPNLDLNVELDMGDEPDAVPRSRAGLWVLLLLLLVLALVAVAYWLTGQLNPLELLNKL